MTPVARNIVIGSLAVVGLLAVASIVDLASGVPFGGQTAMDILFLVAGGLTAYMGVDCLREAR